jgi:hypothetical protein
MELELLLDTEARQAHLRFCYPSKNISGGTLIDGTVQVIQESLRLEYAFVCFGFDLLEFANDVRRIHSDLTGVARFVNQEGSVRVTIGTGTIGRGRLAVGVELQQAEAPIHLAGFQLDQSYLPGMAQAIERFLIATAVDCAHPMLQAGGEG